MKLKFDFIVDKENNALNVKREFAANLDLVWEAWTNPEILDQWWAPKPYRNETVAMDFKIGGTWLYFMISPTGEKHYCKADYQHINLHKSFTGLDAFCDENGKINETFPRSLWINEFLSQGENTMVNITLKYNSLSDLEKIIELGFKEGFAMALGNLDDYFAAHLK
jgi:PhnB protein